MATLKSDRWNTSCADRILFPHGESYCTCCERELTGHAIRMLELDQRYDAYHDFRNVPENESQGWFPFGLTCAKRHVDKARAAISKATGAA